MPSLSYSKFPDVLGVFFLFCSICFHLFMLSTTALIKEALWVVFIAIELFPPHCSSFSGFS